jgi:hypothetical protein
VAEDKNCKKPVSPKRQSAVDLGKARSVVKATLDKGISRNSKQNFTSSSKLIQDFLGILRCPPGIKHRPESREA